MMYKYAILASLFATVDVLMLWELKLTDVQFCWCRVLVCIVCLGFLLDAGS